MPSVERVMSWGEILETIHGLRPEADRVIFNPPATIVYWKDGSKTVVKTHGEDFDEEKGFAMAVVKRLYGRAGTERILEKAQRSHDNR